MKKILTLIAVILVAFSCNKQASDQPQTMTVDQIKTKLHIDLIQAWEYQAAARVANRGKKPEKGDVLTVFGGSIAFDGTTFATSDNPKFAAVNNTSTLISICNWFFWEGGSAQTLSCSYSDQHGNIMAWNTDWTGNLYTSKYYVIP